MSRQKVLTDRILGHLRDSLECELEELVVSCPGFTWNEIFLDLIRLSRTEQVELKSNGRGIYHIRLCSSGQHGQHTHRGVRHDPPRGNVRP